MTGMQKGSVHATLCSIFKSGKYSDLNIRCGDRVFEVHRAIVCPRSHFFAAACDGPFLESINKEIFLEEDNPHTVERMLVYLYTSDYDDGDYVTTPEEDSADVLEDEEQSASASSTTKKREDASATTDEPSLLNNVLVYAIAEKYGIMELKEMAEAKFQRRARSLLVTKEFPEIIRESYRSTPSSDRGLRDIVSQVCAQQGRLIIDSPDLNPIIVEIGEFGLDLLREVLKYEDKRVQEEVARNIVLEEELNGTKEETLEFHRRVSSTSKTLKKVAKGLETGKLSENMFGFWGE